MQSCRAIYYIGLRLSRSNKAGLNVCRTYHYAKNFYFELGPENRGAIYRRRVRDVEGVEGRRMAGIPLPSRLRGLGERRNGDDEFDIFFLIRWGPRPLRPPLATYLRIRPEKSF